MRFNIYLMLLLMYFMGCTADLTNNVTSLKDEEATSGNEFQSQDLLICPEDCFQYCPKAKKYPASCTEATAATHLSGAYIIQLTSISNDPFVVACDDETQGGGWTIIQRRRDGSIDFFRDWNSYKEGFGDLQTEFFIGLDKLHALTNENGQQELLIVLEDFDGNTKYAKYNNFVIGSEAEDYALKKLGKYSGDATDGLTYHLKQKFSTKDRQNDKHYKSCALEYKSGWWYKRCLSSNLNGLYLWGDDARSLDGQGVVWPKFRGLSYSLKDVKMMIRPTRK